MPINDLVVLVVEDDEPKLRSIRQFFSEHFPLFSIVEARSLIGAVEVVSTQKVDFSVIDMSLPTYESAKDPSGGPPQGFGGEDILRFAADEQPNMRAVVLTQYEEFPDAVRGGLRSLLDLQSDLKGAIGDGFLGLLYYSGQHGEWRTQLRTIVEAFLGRAHP